MNCIAGTKHWARARAAAGAPQRWNWLQILPLIVVASCTLTAGIEADAKPSTTYAVAFTITPAPASQGAKVDLALTQSQHLLREMSMRMPTERFRDIGGDGDVTIDGDTVTWRPPAGGGKLSWFVTLQHRRNGGSYDALIRDDWALFRASDIIPAARTRTLKGAESVTTIAFELPNDWSSVTQYYGKNHRYAVDRPERRYSRPTGWILLGDVGTRTDRIAGVAVKVTGPTGHSVRRLDMLAFMHWTLPHLLHLMPNSLQRLTLFSAGEPMWRGGLSAPESLYLHADLPLISENGTSTLLHEVMHVATNLSAEPGADWIVEGLAEYYGLELLRRSHSISADRFRDALSDLRQWGAEAGPLCDGPSTGANTARAVGIMAALNTEMRGNSSGRAGLDDVLRKLVKVDKKLTVEILRQAVDELHGKASKTLSSRNLPGCD